MADFSFHSDTDESESVERILAEAMDHCVLQQVAAINCSSFSNSILPSNLESRFHRLKTTSFSKPLPHTQLASDSPNELSNSVNDLNKYPLSVSEKPKKDPEKKMDFSSGYLSSPSRSSNSSYGQLSSPNFNPKKGEKKGRDKSSTSKNSENENFEGKNDNFVSKRSKDTKLLSKSLSFGSYSSDCSTKTVKTGCFWCSPKKKKKSTETRTRAFELDSDDDDWGKNDEILSDLKSFSEKKQKKLMKLAKKEEEKINKEAEKIVKWAKQASSRMEFSDDDDLSDDGYDHGHNFGLH